MIEFEHLKQRGVFRFRVGGSDWSAWTWKAIPAWLLVGQTRYVGFGSGTKAGMVYRVVFEGKGMEFEV